MMTKNLGFQCLLEGFFLEWLIAGRGLSKRTVEGYRDSFILLLRWFRDDRSIPADKVGMDDLSMENIEAFLVYLTKVRGNAPKTANCRLAALRSFCRYVSYKDPLRLEEMRRILSIPQRKEMRPELTYLNATEVGWLVEACDKSTAKGRECRLLIELLYNTGARISELLALRAGNFAFGNDGSCRMSIIGKGRKERTLPLWPESAAAAKVHIDEHGLGANSYVFNGRNVKHLTRSGARTRIDEIVKRATAKHLSLCKTRITPHTFRHSTAMTMLAAGIDISTIAIWLGHEGIQATHRYMIADMKIKEDAISRIHQDWGDTVKRRYSADPKTLAFLRSL